MPKIYKRNCNYCHKYYEKSNDKFCSRECSEKGQKRAKPVFFKCKTCYIKFKTFPFRIKQGIKYCSSECYGKNLKGKHLSLKTEFKKGTPPWCAGKSNPQLGGENHWNWKGGTTLLIIKIRRCWKYKNWVKSVFERDNWTCQKCKARNGNGKKVYLEAHHIKSFSKIIEKNKIKIFEEALKCEELWNINNGTTLCRDCHNETKTGSREEIEI